MVALARPPTEEELARLSTFTVMMRQSVMDMDALDRNADGMLSFREFSELVREREMGVHTEEALNARFAARAHHSARTHHFQIAVLGSLALT